MSDFSNVYRVVCLFRTDEGEVIDIGNTAEIMPECIRLTAPRPGDILSIIAYSTSIAPDCTVTFEVK